MKLEQYSNTASHFGFSGVGLQNLNATTELTLVTICVDKSGSVAGFGKNIDDAIVNIVEACRKSPRADNLVVRVVEFNHNLHEVHGFKPLIDCAANDYSNLTSPAGSTVLFDTVLNAVESTVNYADPLTKQDYDVNGIVVVVTDGDDNGSSSTPAIIKRELDSLKAKESLDSLLTILVGVNINDSRIKKLLDSFKTDGGLDQYVNLDNASVSTLAKLAQFISKSVTSQSQTLGSSVKSKPLTF